MDSTINNRYQIIRPLGKGGMGETFLAKDSHLPSERLCVIKCLRPQTTDPEALQVIQERFQREAVILEDLGKSCSQIPNLYAYFPDGDSYCLVQEWVEGDDIQKTVNKQGPLSESIVKPIFESLLNTLDYVHSKGIIHRDIKPENVMLSQDGKPVLIDFGAVRELMGTELNSRGVPSRSITIGTPGFMPPEQAAGRPTFSSDLYSLGLTCIYMLTGRIPQELDSDPRTGELQWRNYAPNVSPSLANLLDQAIAPEQSRRLQTAQEVLQALRSNRSDTANTPARPTDATILDLSSAAQGNNSYPATTAANSTTNHGQTVVELYPPSFPPNPSPTGMQKSGSDDWMKAVIIGVLIGGSILGGMLLTRSQNTTTASSSSPSPSPASASAPPAPVVAAPVATAPPATTMTVPQAPVAQPPTVAAPPSVATTPPPSTIQPSSISRDAAMALVNNWQSSKRAIFAPPFDLNALNDFNTGEGYRKNSGSVDWLRNNNSYYRYGDQRIESVENFSASGDMATIDVVITERRELYKGSRLVRDGNTAFDTRLVRYSLQVDNGQLKISDYNTLRVIRSY